MIDYEKYPEVWEAFLVKVLSEKKDSAVLLLKRKSGAELFVLRIYRREIPAYRAIADCECGSLPKVRGCQSRDGLFFVEEEYIDGVSARMLIEKAGRVTEERAEHIFNAACSALICLGEKGYIHRDLKPEHLLVTAEDRVVLVDLDASMKICPRKDKDTEVLGTAGYAAPEQFGFSRSDERTDIYALGILLNELLTGAHPSVKQYRNEPFADLIEKSTRLNPEERYADVSQMQKALTGTAVSSEAAARKQAGKPAGKLLQNKRKAAWAAAGALVLTALIVFGASSLWKDGADEPGASAGADTAADAGQNDAENSWEPATVEGTDYLQLYKDGVNTIHYLYRQGGQAAALYTEEGDKIDQTYEVSVDSSIGTIYWDSKWGNWGLTCASAMPGNTGYFHAEKDGKHYAIRCLVFGEVVSVYTEPPDMDDLRSGYIKAENDGQNLSVGDISLTCQKGKTLTLYLVAAPGFSLEDVTCTSSDVTIEPYEDAENYPYPVSRVSIRFDSGGEQNFTIRLPENLYRFHLTES